MFILLFLSCVEQFPAVTSKQFVANPTEDFDGDGYSEEDGDIFPDGTSADNNPEIYPGAPDICDGLDNDLNGEVDDNEEHYIEFFTDADQDGFGNKDSYYTGCYPFSSVDIVYVSQNIDCDDSDNTVYPGSLPREKFGCYIDADDDGYGDMAAEPPFDSGMDCDDSDKLIYPGNARFEPPESCVRDIDKDGYGDILADGLIDSGMDCDDSDKLIYPGNARFEPPESCVRDIDKDGYGDVLAEYPIHAGMDCNDFEQEVYPGHLPKESANGCYIDIDGDGYGDEIALHPYEQGTDCNDNNVMINKSKSEICDGLDNNCNGIVDGFDINGNLTEDPIDGNLFFIDEDLDGFGDGSKIVRSCSSESTLGISLLDGDCDDSNDSVYPNANEYCDEIDHDCNGIPLDIYSLDAPYWYQDLDGDGFGDYGIFVRSCQSVDGFANNPYDCADGDEHRNPDIQESCNQIDDDCDGIVDEEDSIDAQIFYFDSDGDGFAGYDQTIVSCLAMDNFHHNPLDCDDLNSHIHPLAPEVCDGLDNNCDDDIDGDDTIDKVAWYEDEDEDGYGNNDSELHACTQPIGMVTEGGDCNDNDQNIHNGDEDQDGSSSCDGDCDDSDPDSNLIDVDQDGFNSCNGDCNDFDFTIHPSNDEICDGLDNNCDGTVDGLGSVDIRPWFQDLDNDGFGSNVLPTFSCLPPDGFVENNGDCDDEDPNRNPNANELCSTEEDDDCDGQINDNSAIDSIVFYQDNDNDGAGTSDFTIQSCSIITGFVPTDGDCDDNNIFAKPGLTEKCNGFDDDCDGMIDEIFDEDPESPASDTIIAYIDEDGDGFGLFGADSVGERCVSTNNAYNSGFADNNLDCDDDNDAIHPNASEICDETIDMNCDGDMTLGAIDPVTWYVDADNDQYGDPDTYFVACSAPSGFVENKTDCIDIDSDIYPDAQELCNGKLDDCNSTVDFILEPWYLEDQMEYENGGDVLLRKIPLNEWDHDGDNYVECELDVILELWSNSQRPVHNELDEYQTGLMGGNDCDDSLAYVYPAAVEICNGHYDNCLSRENLTTPFVSPYENDVDNDGYIMCDNPSPIPLDDDGNPEWFGDVIDNNDDGIHDNLTEIEGEYYALPSGDCSVYDEYSYTGVIETLPNLCVRDQNEDGFPDCSMTDMIENYDCDYGVFIDENIGLDFNRVEGSYLSFDNGNAFQSFTVSHPFFMMTTEVTNSMYLSLMDDELDFPGDDNQPVRGLHWNKAVLFANKLSVNQGYEICYSCSDTAGEQPCLDETDEIAFYDCSGFTLPLGHEFTVAGTSGTTEMFWTGQGSDLGGEADSDLKSTCNEEIPILDGINDMLVSDYAWYCSADSSDGAMQVGLLLPNGLGLYDMQGNVREYLHESSDCRFEDNQVIPCTLSQSSNKLTLGGSMLLSSSFFRLMLGDRWVIDPNNEYIPFVGFRLTRRIP